MINDSRPIFVQIAEMIENDIVDGILYKKRGIGMFVATGAQLADLLERETDSTVDGDRTASTRTNVGCAVSTPVVAVERLSRRYREVKVLDNVSLRLEQGTIYGLLGRICFIREAQKHPDNFKPVHAFKAAALFYRHWDQAFALEQAEDFQLPMNRRIKKLSRGQRSTVGSSSASPPGPSCRFSASPTWA